MLHGHGVLSHDGRCAPCAVLVDRGAVLPGEVHLGLLIEEDAQLRTCLDKELEPTTLTPPPQTCKDRYLQVGHVALIGLGHACHCIDDGLVLGCQYLLFPSHLGNVQLTHDGTDTVEVFLGGIAHGQTARQPLMLILGDAGREADAAEQVAAIDTDGKLTAVVAYLCRGEKG